MTVLSLVELCSLAIRNGIEDGSLRLMHETLPLDIRRCIFNAIAMHSTFDNPNCIDLIVRPEFLDGFATFDMKSGKVSKEEISPTAKFLDRMIPIFATVKDGEFFGSNITDLRVAIYYSTCVYFDVRGGTTLPTIIRLVAECRKLTKLVLRMKEFDENVNPTFNDEERESLDVLTQWGSNILNVSDPALPWLPVLENLEKLAIISNSLLLRVLNSDEPVIPFKRLSSLRSYNCSFEGRAWPSLLRTVQPSLKILHLDGVPSCSIPFPMPVLEKFRDGGNWAHNALGVLVANMADCPRLTHVHLDMDEEGVSQANPETVARLAGIPNLELDFYLQQEELKITFGLGPNQYRFISTLSSRIRKVKLMFDPDIHNQSHTVALLRFVDTCHDLTTFEYDDWANDLDVPDLQAQEARRIFVESKQHLVRLFGDKLRASKLISLRLASDLDDYTLNLVSENCTNLKRLRFEKCSQLSDRHLFTMARRGVVLSKILIQECPNILGEGLLSLITKSGPKLEEFNWDEDDKEKRQSIEMVLMRNCKYVKREFKLDHVKHLASKHCFHIGSDYLSDEEDVEEDF